MERQAADGTFYKQVGKDEWTPITRTAKDGTVYKKVGKDEWSPVNQQPQEPSFGDKALDVAGSVGRAIDRYTGAPFRAGIGAAQEGKNPISAAYSQFGEDPEIAPTGKRIAQRAGVPDTSLSQVFPSMFTDDPEKAKEWLTFQRGGPADITASGAAGLGIDVVADPINFIPGGLISKGLQKGVRGIERAGEMGKKAFIRGGHALTGVPEKNIATYIEKMGDVDELIARHGGDMSAASDELRLNLLAAIQSKISSLNKEIGEAIAKAPEGSYASNKAIIDAMEHVKSGINPKLYPEVIDEIDTIINKIKGLSEPPVEMSMLSPNAQRELSAAMNAKAANEAKMYLQDLAKGTYLKGGQLFSTSKGAARAAKQGGREARKIEMALAPETVSQNAELARLHQYEQNVNKNLITPGRSEAALMAAGAGANSRNVKNLKDIGAITGFDALGEAEKLSAARSFGHPGLLPVDTTGKSYTRMAVGTGLGSVAGGPMGALIGAAFTSPATLKAAIKVGNVSADVIKKLSGMVGINDKSIKAAIKAAGTPEGQLILKGLVKAPTATAIQQYDVPGLLPQQPKNPYLQPPKHLDQRK